MPTRVSLAAALVPAASGPAIPFGCEAALCREHLASHLIGSAAAPLVVRQYPDERATIDSSLLKQITDSILFNSFSFGIHAYTEGGVIDNSRSR